MKYLKDYGYTILKFLAFLLGGSLLLSLFYYFLFPTKIIHILSFVYMLLLFFVFGFKAGKKSENKGFIAGLKVGVLFLFLLFIINLIFYQTGFKWIRLFYYLLLLFTSIIGATIGINTKKE